VDLQQIEALRQAAALKLDLQGPRAALYQEYYDNQAGIVALLDTDERRTFTAFLEEAAANWCELVVNAVAERLQVVGFRFGTEADSAAAWAIWQANQMDADAEMVQTDALVQGSSFVLVQPDEANPSGVSITPESALQATVVYEPGSRRRRLAGYKRFSESAEPEGYGGALLGPTTEVLILPDQIVTWEPNSTGPVVQDNPAGFVGMVELAPQPRTLGPPRSELISATTFQDRINTTIFNRLVATDYGAFRQIWATGIKVARDVIKTADGEAVRVVRPFDVGANRLLTNEDPAGRFGAFGESTLGGYLASVEQDIHSLAAITQTPAHYLLGQLVNLSADAIKAAEAGLVAKCRRRARHIGEGWEEVMRLAFQLTGSPAAADTQAEVVWADMETRSEGQRVDALVKMATLGVPRRVLWQKWGATPQEITEWEALAKAEPPPPPAPSPAPPQPQPVPVPAP
jgi:Phage portal protein, SPP1 Gp6-like